MTREALLAGHRHAEAYCLMWYQSRDESVSEYIWNSRDGVTPFTVHSRDGVEMRHVHFEADRYLPDFKPPEGLRIFIDITPEWARQSTKEFVERFWEPRDVNGALQVPGLCERYETKEDAIESLMAPLLDPPGQPCIYPS